MKYVIRKVPERNTKYLERLIPDALVYNDTVHEGAIWSFVQAIEKVDDDAVYVQDDMILCRDFIQRTQEYVNKYPDEVIVFSNFSHGKLTQKAVTEGFFHPKEGGWLLCTYIPKELAKGFAQWWRGSRWRHTVPASSYCNWIKRQYDDIFFRQYLIEQGRQVFVTVPNLAGHPKNESVIDKRPPKWTTNFDFENAEPRDSDEY